MISPNLNLSVSTGASSVSVSPLESPTDTKKSTAPRLDSNTSYVSKGELAGRSIRVESGEARKETVSNAQVAKKIFTSVGKVLAGIVLAPVALVAGVAVGGIALAAQLLRLPRLVDEKILEPIANRKFENANKSMLQALRQPTPGSLAQDQDVLKRLEAHARGQGCRLSTDEIRNLVASGEKLAGALTKLNQSADAEAHHVTQGAGGSPLSFEVDGKPVTVASSLYTTRALSWYMMATAAQHDSNRAASKEGETPKTSSMVTSGSFVMKDAKNAVYNFLAAAPTAGDRISTHFNERVDHGNRHTLSGLFGMEKAVQKGIEDYTNSLPGKGGTMLFDKLTGKDGGKELFIKFESTGCPPLFKLESHQSVGQTLFRAASALSRNLDHATSFVNTLLSDKGSATAVTRQEHVHKGELKSSIAKPFNTLVKKAIEDGLLQESAKYMASSVKSYGLPFIKAALDNLEAVASKQGNKEVLQQIDHLRQNIASASDRLGDQTDKFGIERRGAEVHVSLNPADNVRQPST
jgi:hypothetical protein